MVVDDGLSGLRIGVGSRSGHTGVREDPERNVVTTKHRRLEANHVIQKENVRLSHRLPVLYLKSENKKNKWRKRSSLLNLPEQ